ncbi:MAG TPA: hypothetical protein V6D15_11730 [Oculatellaceae cyanobacterium]|jgi:hypothetical protein
MVDIQQQKNEFQVRFYNWSLTEAQREVEENYPSLRKFNGLYALEFLDAICSFEEKEQYQIIRSLTRHAHRQALDVLGDSLTRKDRKNEKEFSQRKNKYFLKHSFNYNTELSKYQERLTRTSSEICESIGKYLQIFSNDLGHFSVLEKSKWRIRKIINTWNIDTRVKFDSEQCMLMYVHHISDINIKYSSLSGDILMLNCLGMAPAIWTPWTEQAMTEALQSIVSLCTSFFEAATHLVDGLSFSYNSTQILLSNNTDSSNDINKRIESVKYDFHHKFYKWCLTDARREVEADFPFIKQINNFDALYTLFFMRDFPKEKQLETMLAIKKYAYCKNLKIEDTLTLEEEKIHRLFVEHRLDFYTRYRAHLAIQLVILK